MDISEKIKIIASYFQQRDETIKKKHGKPFFNTTHGIWGASSIIDAYELFLKMRLEEYHDFVDLGSGDGRIVFVAALFTNATGIEADEQLHNIAEQAKHDLQEQIPEFKRCTLRYADYSKEDLTSYDVPFTFADHHWNEEFEEKLLTTVHGVLLSYNKIFLPKKLKKGKTYWIQQLPIISYHLNIQEKNIFQRL